MSRQRDLVLTLEETLSNEQSLELSSLGEPKWTYVDAKFAQAMFPLELRRLRLMSRRLRDALGLLEKWNKRFCMELVETERSRALNLEELNEYLEKELGAVVAENPAPLGLTLEDASAQRAKFLSSLRNSPLRDEAEFLSGLVRTEVTIDLLEEDVGVGRSKFGGRPDLPQGTAWPRHRSGPYEFLGQLNFAEMLTVGTDLPENGLLSLYAATRPYDEFEPFDEEFVVGLFVPPGTELAPVDVPSLGGERVNDGGGDLGDCSEVALSFYAKLAIPDHDEQVEDWPYREKEWSERREIFERFESLWRESTGEPTELHDNLAGYPTTSTHGSDPAPGPEWVHLISFYSHSDWCWGGGDFLQIFIERERLKNHDFSNLRSSAG